MLNTTYLTEGMSYLESAKKGIKKFDEWSDISYSKINRSKILKDAFDHLFLLAFSGGSVADILITGDLDLMHILAPATGIGFDVIKNKAIDITEKKRYQWWKYEDKID